MAFFNTKTFRHKPSMDRGTRRGAKRVIVTEALQVIDHALAKQHGLKGTHFQSRSEALRWVHLKGLERAGLIRNLKRQHDAKIALYAVNPDGLKVVIGHYLPDATYDERGGALNVGETGEAWEWTPIVEDTKPSGSLREDTYLLKKKIVETQFGFAIREWTGR